MAEVYLKQWLVPCQTCGDVICNNPLKPTECPNNPAHVIGTVSKLMDYPTTQLITSPNGTLWGLKVSNTGVLTVEEV